MEMNIKNGIIIVEYLGVFIKWESKKQYSNTLEKNENIQIVRQRLNKIQESREKGTQFQDHIPEI